MTGEEREVEVAQCLEIIEEYVHEQKLSKTGFAPHHWMMDGATGLRQGVQRWYKPRVETLKIAMCFRHVLTAIQEKSDKFPRGHVDVSQAVIDVKRLAELPPSQFERAWTGTKLKW